MHVAEQSVARTILNQATVGGPIDAVAFNAIAKGLAEQAAVNAEAVIAAASIVLSHSTADDVFTQACGISIALASDEWGVELNEAKKVNLGDVRKMGVKGIFARELEQYKSRLGAKSLPTRAELLFRHVKIRKHKDIGPEDDLYFKTSKLQEADHLRHEIIHGRSRVGSIPITKAHATAQFLHEAATTALRSLAWQYGIEVDYEYMRTLSTASNAGG